MVLAYAPLTAGTKSAELRITSDTGPGVSERAPSAHEALTLLSGLEGETRANAEEYVRRIPAEIRTLYRGLIENRLGWMPMT